MPRNFMRDVTFGWLVIFKVFLRGHLPVTSRKTNAWLFLILKFIV
jgi:hypothetical protein